jgi:hypothetical protein
VHLDVSEDALITERVFGDISKMSVSHFLLHIENHSGSQIDEAAFEDVLGIDPLLVDDEIEAMGKPRNKPTISGCCSLNFFHFIVRYGLLDVRPFIQSLGELYETPNGDEIKETINRGDIHDMGWYLFT